ncbi:hypothetical protein GQX74_006326 [Glossina fuscipes]|nr:hypothetical protein GQX74_006326 [Glossina fuscipes]
MASSKKYQKPMQEQMDKAFFLKVRTSRAPSQRFSPISKNIRISQSRKHLPIKSDGDTFERSRFESEMNEHLKNLSENVEGDIKKQAKCKFSKYFASSNPTILFLITVAKAELLCDLNRKVLNQLVDERKKAQLLLKDALQNIKLLQRELDQPLTQRKQLILQLLRTRFTLTLNMEEKRITFSEPNDQTCPTLHGTSRHFRILNIQEVAGQTSISLIPSENCGNTTMRTIT